MNPYRPTFGIEPIDPYEKAKQDLITAFNSVSKLSPMQQEILMKELFGAANVVAALNLLRRMG